MARVAALLDRPRPATSLRLAAALLPLLLVVAAPSPRADAQTGPLEIDAVADLDDDDLNGLPDGSEASLAPGARADVVPLDASLTGSTLVAESGGDHARILVAGRPLAWGERVPAGAGVQGLSPGIVAVHAVRGGATRPVTVVVSSLGFRDGQGRVVDPARSHASLDRTPPGPVVGDASSTYEAPDPLRLFVVTPASHAPPVTVESVGASGAHLDLLAAPALERVGCADAATGLSCFASQPLRFVIDDVDRRHALASARSLRAELGGAVVLRRDGRKAQAIRILGPRDSLVGPIGRLRATVRPFVVRVSRGGAPSVGGTDAGAIAAMRAELAGASAAWSECGVTFGPPEETAVHVVDPPPPHLVSFGDDLGLPASGGHVRLRVGGHGAVDVATTRGETPLAVARRVAAALERAGLGVVVSPNARVGSAAYPSVDLSVRLGGRDRTATLATLEPVSPDAPLTDDPTLVVRIGAVDLTDGLAHFGDVDSVAGTLEERTLLKAIDDGDPSSLEVVVVPFFSGGGRIGESFIGTDRSSLRDVVVLDRAGVRARRSSLTLAHELGHVLLDVPGHPDDFGTDTPTQLMDADAADASPFGPRRLTLAECARVVRQSGPGAHVPLLRPWPLTPIVYDRR